MALAAKSLVILKAAAELPVPLFAIISGSAGVFATVGVDMSSTNVYGFDGLGHMETAALRECGLVAPDPAHLFQPGDKVVITAIDFPVKSIVSNVTWLIQSRVNVALSIDPYYLIVAATPADDAPPQQYLMPQALLKKAV